MLSYKVGFHGQCVVFFPLKSDNPGPRTKGQERMTPLTAQQSSQGYGFSIVMYGCESWTVKKAECQRIDAFEL